MGGGKSLIYKSTHQMPIRFSRRDLVGNPIETSDVKMQLVEATATDFLALSGSAATVT